MYVYQSTLFTSVPLQAVVDSLLTGRSVGERSGDIMYSTFNLFTSVSNSYLTGVNLLIMTEKLRDFREGTINAWKNLVLPLKCNVMPYNMEATRTH